MGVLGLRLRKYEVVENKLIKLRGRHHCVGLFASVFFLPRSPPSSRGQKRTPLVQGGQRGSSIHEKKATGLKSRSREGAPVTRSY